MTKEQIKTLFQSFRQEDFYKDVDLHIHSCESDGVMTPYEIIDQAKRLNMRYIAIADHNTIDSYLSTNILSENMVIPAVEFDCFYKGVLIHIIGYGINIDDIGLKSLYATNKMGKKCNLYRIFKLRNPNEVIKKINKAGGIAVLAHPCCYWTPNLEKFVKELVELGLEGIEVYYNYYGLRKIIKFHSEHKVRDIADKYNLIKTGGTDSHGKTFMTLM